MQKFRNCFWLLLAILSGQGFLQGQNNEDCGCAIPAYGITGDIMRCLAQSGTKWWGNREWIKDLKKGVSIETYLKEESTDDVLGEENVDKNKKIKAKFIITHKNDGSVIIKSLIDYVRTQEKLLICNKE